MTVSAIPSPTVTVYLDLPFNTGAFFTLNDPAKGLLDNATYLLGGDLGSAEITADAYDISISRGRSTVLDQTDTGTATVSFRNFARDWDPLNTSSPYIGSFTPGNKVEIVIYGRRIFTGYTDDWLNSYSVNGDAVGSFPCIDGLGLLSRQQFNAWTATNLQKGGARVASVLNRAEVGWPAGLRDLDTGVVTLQGDSITWGSNPLNYLQLISESDQGNLFVDRKGVMTYRDAHSLTNPSPIVTFADDGSGLPFADAQLSSAGERFFSSVSVDREGGTVQTVNDAGVGQASSIRRLSLSGLLMNTDAQAKDLADWLLNLYKTPTPKVKTLTVNFAAFDDVATCSQVAALDLSDVVHVTWTPLQTGSTIDEDYTIELIEHAIPYTGPHVVTFTLAPVAQSTVFTLDDATLGKLNGHGRLAF